MLVWQGPASFGDHGSHFTPKTQGFAPENVFKPELTRSQSLTRPNYLMMMWLPWCGGHDDVVGQWQSSSRTVSCTFTDLIFQNGSETLRFFKSFSSRNRALATVSCTVCQPHLPKEFRDLQFFNIFKWKSSSRYSLVRFLCQIELSLQYCAHFADLIFKKCLIALWPQSRAFFFNRFPRSSRAPAETESLLQRRKNTGFRVSRGEC